MLAVAGLLAAPSRTVDRRIRDRVRRMDIAFYVFLKLFLEWPASLLTWDILFLIRVPWVGPMLAPVLVSA